MTHISKMRENMFTGRRVVLYGQTDGKTDSQKDKDDDANNGRYNKLTKGKPPALGGRD